MYTILPIKFSVDAEIWFFIELTVEPSKWCAIQGKGKYIPGGGVYSLLIVPYTGRLHLKSVPFSCFIYTHLI